MARAIIISHPSELIRKGVLSVLENEIVSPIHCFQNINDIKKDILESYTEIIFILPLISDYAEILLKRNIKAKNIILGGLNVGDSAYSAKNYDFIFNINNPIKELVEKVKHYFLDSDSSDSDEELTVREKEVLKLIALGHTNKSIAKMLFISIHTVISHRKNITEKLGIKSIPGLTVYAIIQKIISQADISSDQVN